MMMRTVETQNFASLRHCHHPLDAHLRLPRQILRQINLRKLVFERQVNLFQRVALHIDADIERVH